MAALDKMKNPKALARMAEKEQNVTRKATLLDVVTYLEMQKRDRSKRLRLMGINKISGKKKWKERRHRKEHDRINKIHSRIGSIMRDLQDTLRVYDASEGQLSEIVEIYSELEGIKREISNAGKSRKKWSSVIEKLFRVSGKMKKLFLNHEFRANTKMDEPVDEEIGRRLYGFDVHEWTGNMMSCRSMYEKLNGKRAQF